MTVDAELITVPGYINGDYCTRYRGPDLHEQGIHDGDILVVAKPADKDPETGRLVVTITDRKGRLAKFEPGMSFEGVVTGVMRKIGGDS
jgi:SOS-response transcriptional repressor LexA